MQRYENYEDWVEVINERLPEVPQLITGEWLEQEILNRATYFRNWGFCFNDLTDYDFEDNIDPKIIRKVSFSTRTIFPENNPFKFDDSIYSVDEDIKKLHNEGINGEGINVAVIDFEFNTVHDELKESLKEHISCHDGDCEFHFHGSVVSTQFCGKNLGVAPKANLYFYGTGQTRKNTIIDNYKALKDIYERNLKGANIKVVNISSSEDNPDSLEIIDKLKEQGCTVIDSILFGENFTSINQDANTKEYYYSDWQILNVDKDELRQKIAIPTGGKMTPLVTTESDYIYCGQATYSWAIPKLSGFFTLALQIEPNLTFDKFVSIARETAEEKEGILFFNMEGIIEYLKQNKKHF